MIQTFLQSDEVLRNPDVRVTHLFARLGHRTPGQRWRLYGGVIHLFARLGHLLMEGAAGPSSLL